MQGGMSVSNERIDKVKIIDKLDLKDSYNYLIDYFTEERIVNRINSLAKRALRFIDDKGWNGIVGLNKEIIMVMVIDYFADIYRLKAFHDDIERINLHKIYSYTAYWWIKRKPLQVLNNHINDEKLAYVNEEFMSQYLFYELVKTSRSSDYDGLIKFDKNGVDEVKYLDELNYFLRYRLKNANSMELALETFEFALKLFKKNQLECKNSTK